MDETDVRPLPQYKCHKVVGALKIREVVENPNGSLDVLFEEDGFDPINVVDGDTAERLSQSGEADPGYYVVYDDDYVSWSPTQKFEDGYARV